MYPCSNAFHEAVANNAPQMAIFEFADGIITNEDIDLEAEVEFKDYLCTTEDLGIGEALSNELIFRVMNDKQLLNNFPFGEFTALLGARISVKGNGDGMIMEYGGHVYTSSPTAGRRLLRDGKPTAGQPNFLIAAMAAKDSKIYCFSADGEPYAVSSETGAQTTWIDNGFMRDKWRRWYGHTYSYEDRILTVVTYDTVEKYEFVPLGIFEADRPKVTDDVQFGLECNDRMTWLDKDMDLEITYPITAGGLLNRVCESANIPVAVTSFINQGATLAEAPQEFETCTKRDVVAWIAEIAGANAKISRDGEMTFLWLTETSLSFDESDYTECRPYRYQTKKVTKLVARDLVQATDSAVGSGSNTYLIQDNPFLK